MADLVAQRSDYGGTDISYVAADPAGDKATAVLGLVVHLKNDNVAPVTVTFASPVPCNQGFSHNQPVTIPAGEARFVGPFASRFVDNTQKVAWTYDDATNITVAALVVA